MQMFDPLAVLKRGKCVRTPSDNSSSSSDSDSDSSGSAVQQAQTLPPRRQAIRRGSLMDPAASSTGFSSSGGAIGSSAAHPPKRTPTLLLQVRKDRRGERKTLLSVAGLTGKAQQMGNAKRETLGLRGRLAMKIEAAKDPVKAANFTSSQSAESPTSDLDSSRGSKSGAQSATPTEEESLLQQSPILKGLKLKTQRHDRLDRLEKLTTLHWSSNHAKGVTAEQRQRYEEVFKRYDFHRRGGLDLVECINALADLGLKPSGRKDKLYIKTRIDMEGGQLDFPKFCSLVAERQAQLQSSQRAYLRQLFKQYDTDGSGSLSAEELIQVFADLQLKPECDDESSAFLDAVVESDVDGSGEIEWAEFEILVQVVRQKISECRREREARIAQQMRLPAHVFLSFRHVLVALHDAFRQFDHTGCGCVDPDDIPELIFEMGFDKSLTKLRDLIENDETIQDFFSKSEEVDFAVLLQIVERLREIESGSKDSDTRRIFEMYDIDHSGSISEDELLWLLRDLQLDDRKLGGGVSQLLEECDADGNGVISFDEFKVLFTKIAELREREQREAERAFAETQGFDGGELHDMREIFSFVGGDKSGCLSLHQVAKVLKDLGHDNVTQETLQSYDSEKLGRVDFKGFVMVMRDVVPKMSRRRSLKRMSALSHRATVTEQMAPLLGVGATKGRASTGAVAGRASIARASTGRSSLGSIRESIAL